MRGKYKSNDLRKTNLRSARIRYLGRPCWWDGQESRRLHFRFFCIGIPVIRCFTFYARSPLTHCLNSGTHSNSTLHTFFNERLLDELVVGDLHVGNRREHGVDAILLLAEATEGLVHVLEVELKDVLILTKCG